MKSSRLKVTSTTEAVAEGVAAPKASLCSRLKGFLKQFKRDLREPLPESEGLTLWPKIKLRCRHLFKRYGWRLLVAICVYYLIRDGVTYILIPYLVARKLLID
ncbi:MAG: hypothetical protein WBP29_00950 [Candidatus Zixiibacteriota bacterium]